MESLTLVLIHLFALAISLLFLFGVIAEVRHTRRDASARPHPYRLTRSPGNPLVSPSDYAWEQCGTFNPAAVRHDGMVHLFYRALGSDGISRIGYARSDGTRIVERLPYPVFALDSPATFSAYRKRQHPGLVASGGSWAGTEDPRAVVVDDTLFLSFSAFSGWDSIRVGVVSLPVEDLTARRWRWSRPIFLSPPDEVHKNWVIFPRRVKGKIAVLHSLHGPSHDQVAVDYLDTLDREPAAYVRSPFARSYDDSRWDYAVRGAGAPPLETEHGWLVFYHATDKDEPHRYKVGALLLDRDDPSRIIARSPYPILAPDAWYENEGMKAGVVYICGAIRDNDIVHLYYGGADSAVCTAHLSLSRLMRELVS